MNSKFLIAVIIVSCLLPFLNSAAVPDQDSGYVDVRPGAHMFWWLYGSSHPTMSRDQLPLVMWLQGGPGGSSTGFGNFEEIGPLNVKLQPRNTTWTQAANIIFVDNPVGTGFSYVDDKKYLTRNNKEIANDLVSLMKGFLSKYHLFEEIPFYVFCESYGGKMTAAFGAALQEAIKAKTISVNFKGVALGDGWVSPMDTVKSWGPYLYATSLINSAGVDGLQKMADMAQAALDKGNGTLATAIWSDMENYIKNRTDGVDFYNILNHNDNDESIVDIDHRCTGRNYIERVNEDDLNALMNGKIKKQLNIPEKVMWGGQAGLVFSALTEDFMKDAISDVDVLLSAGIKVVIYNGQLDLIVDVLGTLEWIKKLKWGNVQKFMEAHRRPFYSPSGIRERNTAGFIQHYENLYFYWILKAGHMVPRDAGDAALTMLKNIVTS